MNMKKYYSLVSIVVLLSVSLCFAFPARASKGRMQISNAEQSALLVIKVNGTRGGHSGADIGRTGSALSLLIDLLFPINDLRLVSISTRNDKPTAIPENGEAVVLVPQSESAGIQRSITQLAYAVSTNPFYVDVPASGHRTEREPIITVSEITRGANAVALDTISSRRVLTLLAGLPVGPQVVDELGVVLSSNLARVTLDAETSTLSVQLTTRFNDDRLIDTVKLKLDFLGSQLQAKVIHNLVYKSWVATDNPEEDELGNIAKQAYKAAGNGESLKFKRVHAGMELPILVSYFPGIKAISLGADIEGAHSENERLNLDSLKITYGVAAEMLRALAKTPAIDLRQYYAERADAATTLFIEKICPLPRDSANPEPVVAFLEKYAKEHGLIFEKDKANNVLIRSQGSCAVTKPLVVLHAHHDMVVAGTDAGQVLKRGVKPIRFQERGIAFLKGDKSSLGADNGIGIALGLTLLTDAKLCHGELAMLFTADEERGLVGAKNLGQNLKSMLRNAQTIISLDGFSSAEGEFGSAGFLEHVITLPVQFSKIR
jgi:di/tripeptidase